MIASAAPESWSHDWASARRILAVRLDSMGDVLMTGPALRALAASAPERAISVLTSPSGAAAAALLPEVAEVIEYDAPWLKATSPRVDSRPDLAMIERLRAGRFDAAVVFTVYSQNPLPSALLCFLADIPLRLAHARENPYQLLTHWVPEPEPEAGIRHEVRRQLDLVGTVGGYAADERMRLHVRRSAVERARGLLRRAGLAADRPWAVIHAGSTAASRRYPPEAFARVLAGLDALGWQTVWVGDAGEAALIEEIHHTADVAAVSLAGELTLDELAALLMQAPVLIANNSGPVHVAAAVGTPVVDLYALTNPQHTPWGVPSRVLFHDVPCRWCYRSICPEGHHDCLRLVPPEDVVRAAVEIARTGRPAMAPVESAPAGGRSRAGIAAQ